MLWNTVSEHIKTNISNPFVAQQIKIANELEKYNFDILDEPLYFNDKTDVTFEETVNKRWYMRAKIEITTTITRNNL